MEVNVHVYTRLEWQQKPPPALPGNVLRRVNGLKKMILSGQDL
jgi:hypothetical protein